MVLMGGLVIRIVAIQQEGLAIFDSGAGGVCRSWALKASGSPGNLKTGFLFLRVSSHATTPIGYKAGPKTA